jgi:hypothetical protein
MLEMAGRPCSDETLVPATSQHHVGKNKSMQNEVRVTPWHIIESQINRLKLVEARIEDLRSMLAEDWRFRLSGPETNVPTAAARAGNFQSA